MTVNLCLQVFADVNVNDDGSIVMTVSPGDIDTDFVLEHLYEDKDDDERERIAEAVEKLQAAARAYEGDLITVKLLD